MSTSAAGDLDLLQYLAQHKLLDRIIKPLGTNIHDLFNLARTCKSTWNVISCDHELWRTAYLSNEPLITSNLKKRFSKPNYCNHAAKFCYRRIDLCQCCWMRACTLLYHKPRLVLALSGRDPIITRRLGQPESDCVHVRLHVNYHLDSALDENDERFSIEFPQVFQDLDPGDLVITQDYRGAGCWVAVPDPESHVFVKLRKNGHDSGGYGILSKDIAPPTFPLFYYCDANITQQDKLNKPQQVSMRTYWYTYSQLKDKAMYSWDDHEVFDAL